MNRLLPLAFAAAAMLLAPVTTAAPPPKVRAATIDDLAKPLPLPYDEKADADAQVAAAKARAARSGKRLLIDLGGNWCGDCRVLAGIMRLPEVHAFVARHYEVVTVDVGRFDRNGQVALHYGIKDRLAGVPAILVVDPRSDRLINAGHVTALSDARHMTPQALADWLAQWV